MSIRNTPTSYGSISRLFHWLIFLLVLGMILLGYFMGDVQDKVLRAEVVNVHKLLGLSILMLMLLRLCWAVGNIKPGLPFQTPVFQRLAERFVHFLLYATLIIMPVSGFVGAVAGGRPPHLYGVDFVLPMAPNKSLAKFAFDGIHNNLAILLIVLISIHVLAALYHHFIKRERIRKFTCGL